MIIAHTENGKKALTMSIDTTIKERKGFRCPYCGQMVMEQDIGLECSNGRVWRFGYYMPHEKRTEENEWCGKDMVLTEEQAIQPADFVSNNQIYNGSGVECLAARALMRGNKVIINADW